MYKLVNILIENIGRYKEALKTQLDTNLKKQDKMFLLNYKTNLLDKLIAIIFEKFKANKLEYDKKEEESQIANQFLKSMSGGSGPGEYTPGSVLRHGIILKSLKIIAHNNNIQYSDIERKYSEVFKDFLPDIDFEKIVEQSNKDIPKYGISYPASCSNRKDFFQHIINVIYDPDPDPDPELDTEKLRNRKRNIDTLTKLSTSYDLIGAGFVDKDCKTTIDKIIEEKGYLISEASIQSSELKEKYDNEIGPSQEKEMDTELKRYNELIEKYINDQDMGLNSNKKYEPTKKAILKIYDDFKTYFDNKINNSKYSNVNILKPIIAKK
jgi:hypothetical protein